MIRKVCKRCGSSEIRSDAWAQWNEETQEYELDNVFDYTFCIECDGETTEEDEEIEND